MKPKRRLFVGIILGLIFGCLGWWATRSLWSVGAIGLHYDWGWSLSDWRHSLNTFAWSWNGQFLGGGVVFNFGWLLAGVSALLGTVLSLSVQVWLKIWLLSAVMLAGVGMTWLLRRRGLSWWIAILMGGVYALYPTLFIRFIVGFVAYIMAYALLPWWLGLWWELPRSQNPRRLIPLVALIYAVSTAQQQFAVMIPLIGAVDLLLRWQSGQPIRRLGAALLACFGAAALLHLPWLWLSLRGGSGLITNLGQSSSSLALISSLPHDSWRTIFGFDHHITYPIFDTLRYGSRYALSCLTLLGLFFLGAWRANRETKLAIVMVGLTWPLSLGPTDVTKSLYVWIYQHMPLANLFRETFHWSALTALFLVIGAAFGLSWLAKKRWWGWLVSALAVIGVVGLIKPFAVGNFYGYLSSQRTSDAYVGLTVSNEEAKTQGRTFFLPSLGFIKDKTDQTPGAANSDVFAEATNRPQLPYVSSTLDLPDAGNELRNAMLVSWYQLPGAKVNASGYLRALGVSEVVTRPRLVSNFIDLFPAKSNLDWLRRHWASADYDSLTRDQSAVELVESTSNWSRYAVKSTTAKISLAQHPVLAAYDWSAVNGESDAVFYREDLEQTGHLSQVIGAPVVADQNDWQAAGWQQYNQMQNLVVDAGSNPDLGWTRKNSVWWRATALATARESYFFTNTTSVVTGEGDFTSGDYRVLVKVWHSSAARQFKLALGDNNQLLSTYQDAVGGFVWHDLGVVSLAGQKQIAVSGLGETGLAQLLVVPVADYESAQADWPVRAAEVVAPVGTVDFSQEKPTAYRVAVTTDRESWLIVRETYDTGWELRFGDDVYHPVPVNGYAMAFSIPGGDWSGELVYTPQTMYRVWQVVSIGGLLLLLALIFWTPKKRARRRAIEL